MHGANDAAAKSRVGRNTKGDARRRSRIRSSDVTRGGARRGHPANGHPQRRRRRVVGGPGQRDAFLGPLSFLRQQRMRGSEPPYRPSTTASRAAIPPLIRVICPSLNENCTYPRAGSPHRPTNPTTEAWSAPRAATPSIYLLPLRPSDYLGEVRQAPSRSFTTRPSAPNRQSVNPSLAGIHEPTIRPRILGRSMKDLNKPLPAP